MKMVAHLDEKWYIHILHLDAKWLFHILQMNYHSFAIFLGLFIEWKVWELVLVINEGVGVGFVENCLYSLGFSIYL